METMVYKTDTEPELRQAVKAAGELLPGGKTGGDPHRNSLWPGSQCPGPQAVNAIFKAKGRPNDNPLIVHIADLSALPDVVSVVPEKARVLMERFWPGPLTIVLPRNPQIPNETTAVWIRWQCVCRPIRWPRPLSGERSCPCGALCQSVRLPSPTTAEHCVRDLTGKVSAIVDGGPCNFGVESTVITLAGDHPRLLRPGAVTLEQLEAAIGAVEVDHAVTGQLEEGQVAASPGMKYKHYSPKALVYLVRGSAKSFRKYVNALPGENIYAMVFAGEGEGLRKPFREYGAETDHLMQARELFWLLREFDDLGAQAIYVRCPSTDGVGLAVYNRLIRAAAFKFIDLD